MGRGGVKRREKLAEKMSFQLIESLRVAVWLLSIFCESGKRINAASLMRSIFLPKIYF